MCHRSYLLMGLLLASHALYPFQSAADPTIRAPGPELATFPENVNTLMAGEGYFEVSAFGYTGSSTSASGQYNTPFLLEYGVTYDNGFTWNETNKSYRGFEPPTFGALIHLMDEKPEYCLPAIAFEPLMTTDLLGNNNTSGGVQPNLVLTFVNTLPEDIEFNYTLGTFRKRNDLNQNIWEFQFEWALQRSFFMDDFKLFIHGTYNSLNMSPPDLSGPSSTNETGQSVVGGGFILTATERLAFYGQISGGLSAASPSILSWSGFAFAF